MTTIPSTISNAELSALVAEKFGWVPTKGDWDCMRAYNETFGADHEKPWPPPFAESLDAVRELEELIPAPRSCDYAINLYHICVPQSIQLHDHFITWSIAAIMVTATARQRCFALLAAKGQIIDYSK